MSPSDAMRLPSRPLSPVLHFLSLIVGTAGVACTQGGTSTAPLTPPAVDTALVIRPDSVVVDAGLAVRFEAYDRWGTADSALNRAVDWSASGGSIDTAGTFRASAAGTYSIVVRRRGRAGADTARATVRATQVTAVSVTPASVTLQAGAAQRFAATGLTGTGSSVPVAVRWTATGGAIDSTGNYVAGAAAGSFRVVGALPDGSRADTADVTIAAGAPAATLTAVVLAPASVTLPTGGTQQFSVTGQYSDGTTGPVTVAFSATGGTISPAGLFSAGGAAGTFRVIASGPNGTLADTSVVTLALPPVTSCSLSPATATLAAGASQQFAATGRRSDGTSAAIAVTWTATGGTITSTGLYTAGAMAGSFRIAATLVGGTVSCSAAATVSAPAPTLSAIVLTPATATVAAGGTQQFSAAGRMTDGSAGSVAVTYAATGGTISSGGLYTAGSTAGTYRVIATQQGGSLADTSTVTVTAAPPPGGSPLVNECATPAPGRIFCDDFDQDRLSSYFEYDNAGGRFTRTSGVGNGGSYAMKGVYTTAAQTSSGSLKVAFGRTPSTFFRPVDAGSANYRELFWRVYVKNPAGWTGGGGEKLMRATSLVSANWAQAMIAHVWSGGPPDEAYLFIDPASGTDAAGVVQTTAYNDFPNFRWLGARKGSTALFAGSAIGQWHCVEAHVRFNDAGASNGVFEFWVDGALNASRSDLNWVGAFNGFGMNAVFLENYWNEGSPVVQERYLDNFIVSTQRIGC